LQLNYTSRINRPRGRQINPFKDYSDSTNISYGNVSLTPEYANALEFNYLKSWDEHSLSATAFYRFTDQVIQGVHFINNGTMESTFMNLSKSTRSGVELVAKNRLFRVVNLTTSVNVYYSQLDSSRYVNPYNPALSTLIPRQENVTWSGRMIANIMLGKTTTAQISGNYMAPQVIAQGERSAVYAIDLGLRKTFFNRNLSLNLTVRDLLNSRKMDSTTWGEGFYQTNNSRFNGRMIGLTATYNFGNMKPKRPDMKKNAEEGRPNDDMMEEGMD
jgi:outer membrane receptor protein involved in Fe transport